MRITELLEQYLKAAALLEQSEKEIDRLATSSPKLKEFPNAISEVATDNFRRAQGGLAKAMFARGLPSTEWIPEPGSNFAFAQNEVQRQSHLNRVANNAGQRIFVLDNRGDVVGEGIPTTEFRSSQELLVLSRGLPLDDAEVES